jgi:hypothetical protein
MSSSLEHFLARIYTDAELRSRFSTDPAGVAAQAGLDADSCKALQNVDLPGLLLHAQSLAAKRMHEIPRRARPRWEDHLRAWLTKRRLRP